MLYQVIKYVCANSPMENVFQYISFRAVCAALTSLCFSLLFCPLIRKMIMRLNMLENISDVHEGLYEKHQKKQGIPSMGGILIILAIFFALILWADLKNFYIQIGVLVIIGMGLLGFVDDMMKAFSREKKGLTMKNKFLCQVVLTAGIGFLIYRHDPEALFLTIPFFKNISIDLGWLYIGLMFLVILGTCNAVNVTDGLDGLATGSLIMSFSAYAVFAYVVGHRYLSEYFYVLHIPGVGELAVFCAAVIGACMGFLWFNTNPASIFMGDTGSLTLGGALGVVAILVKQELILIIIGGVFVIEMLSVIIQIIFFKTTGRRFFLIAPLHHHFEMKGLSETQIVVRFWILAIVFSLIGLLTLKLR
ncbi:phospho-N-acetylmuramoyl-pentapeptide-transferase [PVC group bacterium (ex Bugula neritina AB1)]|nr:phospho-N-acetylmuramoyl-pentapeptide-transferase [PVC group bacterium (ex Bugula neritina AB1)]